MYRSEHPKPQFERSDWVNLNGVWKFAFDHGLSGQERKWFENTEIMDKDINIPFCPESELSGVKYVDFINGIWYKKDLDIPSEWKGDRVFVHFGGVDYRAYIYVNGKLVGDHTGPVSFSFDITKFLKEDKNELVVFADDSSKYGKPKGKQSDQYYRNGCQYTRTTGIWQTVWLERRPNAYIESVKVVPDYDNSALSVTPVLKNIKYGDKFKVTVKGEGKEYSKEVFAQTGVSLTVDMPNFIPWSPENPFLYDVTYELISEKTDSVKSYIGMRKISVEGNKFYLNNEEIFLRFVLDQGFYPKGIWTAPSDEDLKNDIILSMNAGFNGARLHQKVFEERFLYHADKLGYLVWAEYSDWGYNFLDWKNINIHKDHFMEEMVRDYNHPSIIAWTPYNESTFAIIQGQGIEGMDNHHLAIKGMVNMIRSFDPTRPVNDASGMTHVDTDIYTIHDYQQDPKIFEETYKDIQVGVPYEMDAWRDKAVYEGQPFIVDEYGGPLWAPDNTESDVWGYSGNNDIEEVYAKIEKLTKVLVDNPKMAGYCYTQLTDVEQEKNGIYKYDRSEKFDMKRIKSYFGCPRKK